MVFVEFTPDPSQSPNKWYFVGRDLGCIRRDTNGLREFAGVRMLSYREVSRQEIETLVSAESLIQGIQSIHRGFSVFLLEPIAEQIPTV